MYKRLKMLLTYRVHVCNICTKHCYPNQIHTVRYNTAALGYLPAELSPKQHYFYVRAAKHM